MNSTEQTGSVLYLNSGDWVESLTALEYHNGDWKIFKYHADDFKQDNDEEDTTDAEDLNAKLDIKSLLARFRQEPD
jgi:hypothetical protein